MPAKKRPRKETPQARAKRQHRKGQSTRPDGALRPSNNGKHGGGASPKYTPEMLEKLCDALASCLTDQQAADLVGIDLTTLQDWFKNDAEFSRPIKKARAERLLARVGYIDGANENWQSAAWLLERAHGAQFAPPKTVQRLEHTLADGMSDAAMREAEDMLGLM